MQLLSFRGLVAVTIAASAGALALIAACSGGGAHDGLLPANGFRRFQRFDRVDGCRRAGRRWRNGRDRRDVRRASSQRRRRQLSCSTPDGLPIKFNPIYSGFDGVHTYQVPVFVVGVDPSTVTWGSSDPTMVSFQPYVRGIMITTKKAGNVTIVARVGSQCGSAPLHDHPVHDRRVEPRERAL